MFALIRITLMDKLIQKLTSFSHRAVACFLVNIVEAKKLTQIPITSVGNTLKPKRRNIICLVVANGTYIRI